MTSNKIIVAPFALVSRLVGAERNAVDTIDAAAMATANAQSAITALWREGERGAALAAARAAYAAAANAERATRARYEAEGRRASAALRTLLAGLDPATREAVERTAYAGL